MMYRRIAWRLVLLAAGLAVSSCVGTDVGNPADDPPGSDKTDAEVRFEGVEEPPSEQSRRQQGLRLPGGFKLEQAWLAVDGAGLRPEGTCQTPADPASSTPVVVDLLGESGEMPTVLSGVAAGTYCGLDVYLDPLTAEERPSSVPEALVGHSILLVGKREDGMEFRLEATLERALNVRTDEEGFEIAPGRRKLLLVAALKRWVDRQALGAIDSVTPIVIDAEQNTTAYESFLEALEETIYLYRDDNGNGALEPAERDAPLGSNVPFDERPGRGPGDAGPDGTD